MNKDIQKRLAETLQGAFPGIPIYTGETMDNTERNEHFKGFAKLLWDDLYQVAGALMVDTITESDRSANAEITAKLQTIIAQRAYDLVYHAFMTASTVTLEDANLRVVDEEDIKDVPDLTEWPTPPQP